MEKPDLTIGPLEFWMRHASSEGWINVTARCLARGASVWVEGDVLQKADLQAFVRQCQRLQSGATAAAVLASAEPHIHMELKPTDKLGHVGISLDITPDNASQQHHFQFEIDQSWFPAILQEAEAVLKRLG